MNIGFSNASNREHAAQNALDAAYEVCKALSQACNAACTAQLAYEGINDEASKAYTQACEEYRRLQATLIEIACKAHASHAARPDNGKKEVAR